MLAEVRTNRKWWTAGIAVAVILLILVIFSAVRYFQGRAQEPLIGRRSPIDALAYCAPQDDQLCIVSFSQLEDGAMQVNLQLPESAYPQFTLVINRFGEDSIYECKKASALSRSVVCIGTSQVPGEVLQFKIFSKNQGTLLAEGKISIIGIAIFTPEGLSTGTLEGTITATPSETPTIPLTPGLPTPTGITSTPTPPTPSYPNPYP